jgi:hypothetical protein
VLLGVGEVK